MNEAPEGYEYEAPKGDGKYLRLEKKGDSVRVRLVSKPYIFTDTFNDGTTAQRMAWVVIHKEQVGKDIKKTVRSFKAGPMVYGLIRDLFMDEDWGDPIGYDVEITRTEEKGKYYTVLPKPNGKPLTDEEKQMVKDADLDLSKLYAPKSGQEPASADVDPFAED